LLLLDVFPRKKEGDEVGAEIDDLWLTRDAANYLGWKLNTLEKKRLTGDGPPHLKISGSVRYVPSQVRKWAEAQVRRNTSDSGVETGPR